MSNNAAEEIFTLQSSGNYNNDNRVAGDISYDNTNSGLVATDVQNAIDETVDMITEVGVVPEQAQGTLLATVKIYDHNGQEILEKRKEIKMPSSPPIETISASNVTYEIPGGGEEDIISVQTALNNKMDKANSGNLIVGENLTITSGINSQVFGSGNSVTGNCAHAEGTGTKASSSNQQVFGKYNIEDTQNTYIEIIGNGTDNNNRSNALTVDWNGNMVIAGDLTINDSQSLSDNIVSQNQIQQSGTKIAEITIGSNTTDIYAPSGGGGGSDPNKMDKTDPTGTGQLALNLINQGIPGNYSTTIGHNCEAKGSSSYSGGVNTTAEGVGAHAEGYHTTASSDYQVVFGKYNEDDSGNTYVEIVGNGNGIESDLEEQLNIRTLDWNGNETLKGDLIFNEASSLTQVLSDLLSNFADPYDNTRSYNANDLVTYNYKLYQANTITTIGDFNPVEWNNIKVTDL